MTTQNDTETLPGVGTSFPRLFTSASPLTGDTVVEFIPTPGGYGTDPNLVTPARTWPTVLSEYQRHQIAALCDVLLPSTNAIPGAIALGCVAFFDDWIGAPYPLQQADTQLVQSGLVRLDELGHQLFKNDFLMLTGPQRVAIVDQLFKNGGGDAAFFARFRALMLGAYFTTEVGMRILGYRGNVPLSRSPELSKQTLKAIDDALVKLGL